jgi:energy-coupling factor transporter ATP-binding protein EcfA2
MKASIDLFDPEHLNHLLAEGFTHELINTFVLNGLVKSLTPEEAYKTGFSVAIDGIAVTGGLRFQFSPTFAQLRLDNQNIIPKDRAESSSKYAKYLSLGGSIDLNCVYLPEGCQSVTEGMKDALAFSCIGGIPTGAVAGVNHVTKALPKGCGYTVVFDYDAWRNFEVFKNLIRAGVHCDGKVAIVPEIEGEPKAGGCEYFKAGFTSDDYRKLLENAQTPEDLYRVWLEKQIVNSVGTAADVAVQAGKILGELYGFAEAKTKAEIKALLKSPRFTEWCLDFHAVCASSNNTKATKKQGLLDDAEDTDPVSTAIGLIKASAQLFHSPKPDPIGYAEIPNERGIYKTVPIESSDFKSWVRAEYSNINEVGLNRENMATIVASADAIANYKSPEKIVSIQRVASHNGKYYLYLADDNQTVIEYSHLGWRVCPDSPVKFVIDRYQTALPVPCKGGDISHLWQFVRITDKPDRLLILSILSKVLVPGGTDPILALSGYQGSGKSTAAKYLRGLIDPFDKGGVLSRLPANSENVAIHCQKRRILAIDNVSHISVDQSDFLCTVSTGGGISKRKLHTDSDEIIHDVQNLTILTSIGNVVTRPDLLERSLVVELGRMTGKERGNETNLNTEFDRLHPMMLGAILDLTCAGLAYREAQGDNYPRYTRLTDFAALGEGIEGYLKFPKGILEKRLACGVSIANNITIESSPVASIIKDWITSKLEWKGSPTKLLNTLKSYAKKIEQSSDLPKNANRLGMELKMIESALYHEGIEITSIRTNQSKYISIKYHKTPCVLSTPDNILELETIHDKGFGCVDTSDAVSTPVYTNRIVDVEKNPDNQLSAWDVDSVSGQEILSTQPETLSSVACIDNVQKKVTTSVNSVDSQKSLSTPSQSTLSNTYSLQKSSSVDSVDSTHPMLRSSDTHTTDDEYPYINGDV